MLRRGARSGHDRKTRLHRQSDAETAYSGIDEKSSSDEDQPRKLKRPHKSSSSCSSSASTTPNRAPCFLCDNKGHRSTECKIAKDKWVSIDLLPEELRDPARSITAMIKKIEVLIRRPPTISTCQPVEECQRNTISTTFHKGFTSCVRFQSPRISRKRFPYGAATPPNILKYRP